MIDCDTLIEKIKEQIGEVVEAFIQALNNATENADEFIDRLLEEIATQKQAVKRFALLGIGKGIWEFKTPEDLKRFIPP